MTIVKLYNMTSLAIYFSFFPPSGLIASSAARRLLTIIEDLQRAHQVFERREREEAPNHSNCI